MGLDLLDLHFRLERKLPVRLQRHCLILDRHTTVGDILELLQRRLDGYEIADLEGTRSTLAELEYRIGRIGRVLPRSAQVRSKKPRALASLLTHADAHALWKDLSSRYGCTLPPEPPSDEASRPIFPFEVSTDYKLLLHIRKQIIDRLEWVPIPPTVETSTRPQRPTIFGRFGFGKPPPPQPPRVKPETPAELRRIVVAAIMDCLMVEESEVVDDAELVDDLGAEG